MTELQEQELSDAQKRFQMEKAGGNYGTGTKEMQVPFIGWQLRMCWLQQNQMCAHGGARRVGGYIADGPAMWTKSTWHGPEAPYSGVCHPTQTHASF